MVSEELLSYIKREQADGVANEKIAQDLVAAGWNTNDIWQAFNTLNENNVPPPHSVPRPTGDTLVHTSMWDAFEHILLFISLYIMYFTLTMLLHSFIDKWVPGIESSSNYSATLYASSFQKTMIRGYLAALIVAYPLYSFFFLHISHRMKNNPAVHHLSSRKFFIYLTLVITFIVLLGNVISIVFNFLNGNTTQNFVLHFIATVAISGLICLYYLNQIKEDRKYA